MILDKFDDAGVWSRIRIRKGACAASSILILILFAELGKRLNEPSYGPSPSNIVINADNLRDSLSPEDHRVCLDLIPAAMFSPPLADLQKKFELDNVDVTESDVYHASSFLGATVKFYDDEAQRVRPSFSRMSTT